MQNQNCFIEFDIKNEQNFIDLNHAFERIKEAKNNDKPQPDDYWLRHFPDYVLRQFYFSKNDKNPTFETAALGEFTWPFYALIELLQVNYEIEYMTCSRLSDKQGRLEYRPFNYPYGGISGLVTFVSSFNCKPTIIDDGTSIYRISFKDNGDFSITDLNDPKQQDSSVERFNGVDLLRKFWNRFK
jgi:hypothetical protein